MSYSAAFHENSVHETPNTYPTPSFKEMVYEVSLRTPAYSGWLREVQGAHRLLQALLQGQLMGHYQLLDFLIQPDGLFARVTLKNGSSLSDFLNWIKEKSSPAGESSLAYWNDELQWIKLVPPDRLRESTRLFLNKAESLHREAHLSEAGLPSPFFYFRDPWLTQ